ncbi:MAG TPA: AAA family ATPase [Syntrophales bacterium]|nr:AAA family ATPase [Syntrophales bacterium]
MFQGLFKKERYPIRPETVRATKAVLYKTLSYDIELLNGYYGIIPEALMGGLMHDLQQLVGSGVAGEFRLAFYDPLDSEKAYLERSYRLMKGKNGAGTFPFIKKHPLPTPFEFDIYVYFSDRFLAMSQAEQAQLIKGFDLRWFNFTGGLPGQHNAPDFFPPQPDRDGGRQKAVRSDFTDWPVEEFKEEVMPGSDYALANDAGAAATPPADYSSDSARLPSPDSGQDGARDGERSLRRLIAPPISAEDGALAKQFASDISLFIAAYTDSRKLIDRFTRVSAQMGLIPLQWTFSEGFQDIGGKYAGKYMFSDNYLLHAKLSPLEALGVIRNECQKNTLYLLEDFHYYLRRENMSGQEFVELISIIKSMPEVLKQRHSFVVILAPTLDLPPEVAPIFGVIRDETAGRRLHFLERFGRDLTGQVEENRIKPIVGRDREIYSCLKVLSQMEANNPILVGKAGVGKTAVVEGLAQLIVKKEVPVMFRDKRIIALNLNAMLSGTKYRGEFETRIEGLVEEVKSNVDRIIVFIDEIHTLLGMGATEGSTGAENILKPSLARGEFPCIGATTSEEYRQYIEPDRALARRFQTVTIPEPDVPQSLAILRGIKSVYEKHYGLKITEQALAACVEMAARFLPGQCFPGKAIRMLDGVCASATLAGKDSVNEESVAEEFNRL